VSPTCSFLPFGIQTDDLCRASPRLKDAVIPEERLRDLYLEMLVILRTIFIRCRLVHADFSEYNVL
jgi:RIO kinase 1